MRTLTTWQHNYVLGRVHLVQEQHLIDVIKRCKESVSLIAPFAPWEKYCNSDQGGLTLYAHTQWSHINDIVSVIDNQNSEWVYAAINRYLLICDPDPTANDDYDRAIFDYVSKSLKKFTIIDYQFQSTNYTGGVGNFLIPDNRLLCKKN